jgi:AraC-like DNA-binding protein
MSDIDDPSDNEIDLEKTDFREIENHYYALITRHIERAKLPRVYGWSSQVMMSLIWRMGKTPLEINLVAEELEVPTRTLQNYLTQEGTNFSYLREQIRQHFCILMLMEGKKVEEIYPMLDYADRTGMINAFKRWNGLPPHHFRKLYNVYVKDKLKKK